MLRIHSRHLTRFARPPLTRALSDRASRILSALDIPLPSFGEIPGVYDGTWRGSGDVLKSICPATGEVLGYVRSASPEELHDVIGKSRDAYKVLRSVPAPRRGEVLRQIREELAKRRDALGALVSLEMGKIRTEGEGEVQEFVDICDYAIGLSRMMNGRVINSERVGHMILEVPNPLGLVSVLSAYNFPVAVYGWNLSLSLIAGNATLWKPAPSTPLCSIATTKIISSVLERNGLPGAIVALVTGGKDVGEAVVESRDVDMVSFTGSEATGRKVAKVVQSRFGKVLLELGGNNATIIMPDADTSLALPSTFFGSVGTAGQRCTSTRRLFVHRSIAPQFLSSLRDLYTSPTAKPGDPLKSGTLVGPLHSEQAREGFENAMKRLKGVGAEILCGGARWEGAHLAAFDPEIENGIFVKPTIVRLPPPSLSSSSSEIQAIWNTETFAPILHVTEFSELDEAIAWNNSVPQGLSSSLWTKDVREVGKWIGPNGSDCGIVNVNVGTSGAEIGAAFGGNKSTGWGRESGGDAWKQYVRWSACTINFSDAAPLAQGVNFELS